MKDFSAVLQQSLLESVLYVGNDAPKLIIPEGRLKDMESASREVIS